QGVGSPQADGVRPFMVVRAGDKDVKAGQLLADVFDEGMKQADHIDRDNGDLRLVVRQDDDAGHEGIVSAGCFAVRAEAVHVNGVLADLRTDISFRESGFHHGGRQARLTAQGEGGGACEQKAEQVSHWRSSPNFAIYRGSADRPVETGPTGKLSE